MFFQKRILYHLEMSTILKFIGKLNSISIKILTGFIFQLDNIIQKYIWKNKCPEIDKNKNRQHSQTEIYFLWLCTHQSVVQKKHFSNWSLYRRINLRENRNSNHREMDGLFNESWSFLWLFMHHKMKGGTFLKQHAL